MGGGGDGVGMIVVFVYSHVFYRQNIKGGDLCFRCVICYAAKKKKAKYVINIQYTHHQGIETRVSGSHCVLFSFKVRGFRLLSKHFFGGIKRLRGLTGGVNHLRSLTVWITHVMNIIELRFLARFCQTTLLFLSPPR